ncbi:MAG: MarR family transcriptional regulator [Rhizomicrobium sp.]
MFQKPENDLFYLVHDVAHLMRTKFDQKAREWGMTRAQCIILIKLHYKPGMTQNEMAALCEIEPITVARLVDRLEANGLVKRCPDPSDRRVKRLHLMPEAEPVLERIKEIRELSQQELIGDMDPALRQGAVEALKHMKNKLSPAGTTRCQGMLASVPSAEPKEKDV